MLPGTGTFPLTFGKGGAVQPVRRPAHGDLAQCGKVLSCKEVLKRLLCLPFTVRLARLQALDQFAGFNVHQLHLIGPAKDEVGDALADRAPRDGGDQALLRPGEKGLSLSKKRPAFQWATKNPGRLVSRDLAKPAKFVLPLLVWTSAAFWKRRRAVRRTAGLLQKVQPVI